MKNKKVETTFGVLPGSEKWEMTAVASMGKGSQPDGRQSEAGHVGRSRKNPG